MTDSGSTSPEKSPKQTSIPDTYNVQKSDNAHYRRSENRTHVDSKSRSEERVDERSEGMHIQSISRSVEGSILSAPSPLTKYSAFRPLVMRSSDS